MTPADIPVSGLRRGDHVDADGPNSAYEVRHVETDQGRLQIIDTFGNIHSYHEKTTVHVNEPRPSMPGLGRRRVHR
jgi:hypothetical protein